MIRIDGVKVAKEVKEKLREETNQIVNSGRRAPHLTAILVGLDGASQTYVASKEKDCHEIGFGSEVIRMPETTTESELLELIEKINQSETTDGLIVQLPLPKHISEKKVTDAISPLKDVDGFTPANFGLVTRGEGGYIPATPFGILKLLEAYKIETKGKHVVVLGRSNIVGRPMSILLSQASPTGNATVTLCHSKTENLEFYTKHADIVVVAIGISEFLKGNMLKEGATVIDVGITRVSDSSNPRGYVLKGDADYASLEGVCYAATPVPGGVGPMTRTGLMLNTLEAYKKKFNLD
ncbi:MAG: bifunctional 5,10-methylenetetrahydrofolate dehydrogenase/5,10-methenyltetrahydrofolate cyclohydrolase [Bacteroidetes bacterium]|nr:bifunctional 5,10-methylenetetrahydrofolate dehydrogenase/5,10-methenyltetrahydrofolate cyclohydrolase [Bacteroidota bacterium]